MFDFCHDDVPSVSIEESSKEANEKLVEW